MQTVLVQLLRWHRPLVTSGIARVTTRHKVNWSAAKLPERSLISIEGADSADYLQGLITNDVQHLEDGHTRCICAFMLNHLGRIMADVLIYRTNSDLLLIECDGAVAKTVHKNLVIHKLKKKVSLKMRPDLAVWTVFPEKLEELLKDTKVGPNSSADRLLVSDPRLPALGLFRSVAPDGHKFDDLAADLGVLGAISPKSAHDYATFRYDNGLGEGAIDHPSNAFPLESNGDYLNGISFFKGCYVGQELTARTYHTGVTRKRLMPVVSADGSDLSAIEPETKLTSEDGKKRLGKLRSRLGHRGLGLLYTEEVPKFGHRLFAGSVELRTWTPTWWPKRPAKDEAVAPEPGAPCGRPDHEVESGSRRPA